MSDRYIRSVEFNSVCKIVYYKMISFRNKILNNLYLLTSGIKILENKKVFLTFLIRGSI